MPSVCECPFGEMIIAGPIFAFVDKKVGFSSFFSESKFFSHVSIIVQEKPSSF